MFTVPGDGLADAARQRVLRFVAQFAARGLDVAAPVALFENVVLVVVQGGDAACEAADVLAEEGDHAQNPYRGLDAQAPGVAHLVEDEVAEGLRLIDGAVAEEIVAAGLSALQGEEDGLNDVFHVDEGDVLTLEAYGEVNMALDALGHEEIVFLARTVDSGGAQHHAGEVSERAEEVLGFELALTVGGVGLRTVRFADFFVGLLFAYGTEDAERTEVDELAEGRLCGDERAGQVFGSFGVDGVEVGFVQALGHARGMHHVVELVAVELSAQLFLAGQVQLQEVDAVVLQPFARTAAAHGSPDVHAFAERFFHDEASDEAGSSRYQYFLHICLLYDRPAGASFRCLCFRSFGKFAAKLLIYFQSAKGNNKKLPVMP